VVWIETSSRLTSLKVELQKTSIIMARMSTRASNLNQSKNRKIPIQEKISTMVMNMMMKTNQLSRFKEKTLIWWLLSVTWTSRKIKGQAQPSNCSRLNLSLRQALTHLMIYSLEENFQVHNQRNSNQPISSKLLFTLLSSNSQLKTKASSSITLFKTKILTFINSSSSSNRLSPSQHL